MSEDARQRGGCGNEALVQTGIQVAHGDRGLVSRAATLKPGNRRGARTFLASRARFRTGLLIGWGLLVTGQVIAAQPGAPPDPSGLDVRTFQARGVVRELSTDGGTVVIEHEAISNYMAAMTMSFKAKQPQELAGLRIGERVHFRLRVSETESWIEDVKPAGADPLMKQAARQPETPSLPPRRSLLDFPFTDELGRKVCLRDYHGQALAITFFFTRCPLPDYCPRLSRNFKEATEKLNRLPGAPTNWHFLSVTFDPEFDTPAVLKAYGEGYHYDSRHWSFLTGPRDKLSELADASGVKIERTSGLINHNFRTLIVNSEGHLQMIFPTSGNLSDAIVAEVLKAAPAPGSRPPPTNKGAPEPWSAAFSQ